MTGAPPWCYLSPLVNIRQEKTMTAHDDDVNFHYHLQAWRLWCRKAEQGLEGNETLQSSPIWQRQCKTQVIVGQAKRRLQPCTEQAIGAQSNSISVSQSLWRNNRQNGGSLISTVSTSQCYGIITRCLYYSKNTFVFVCELKPIGFGCSRTILTARCKNKTTNWFVKKDLYFLTRNVCFSFFSNTIDLINISMIASEMRKQTINASLILQACHTSLSNLTAH